METQHNCTLQVSSHQNAARAQAASSATRLMSLGKYSLAKTWAGRDFLRPARPPTLPLPPQRGASPPLFMAFVPVLPAHSGALVPAQRGALVPLPGPSSGWGMANHTGMPAGSSAEASLEEEGWAPPQTKQRVKEVGQACPTVGSGHTAHLSPARADLAC